MPPREPGDEDNLLIRADKNPNTRGAELIGLGPDAGGLDTRGHPRAAAAKKASSSCGCSITTCSSRACPKAEVRAALAGAETVVFQGTNANKTSAAAHLVLPSAAYVERDGTFTNFEGRVQRFRDRARAPRRGAAGLAASWPASAAALGARDAVIAAERAEQVFAALAGAVPAFAGLTYRALGDAGPR